jgi:hypothetical protein
VPAAVVLAVLIPAGVAMAYYGTGAALAVAKV